MTASMAANVIGDIALVIVVASLLGALARRCGQPAVIGQILTGILLGPSVLGRLSGNLTSHLFPHPVLAPLTALADVAVIVFMFTVGYETEFRSLRGQARTAPSVAASALAVPMGLGIGLVMLYRSGFAAVGEPNHGRSFVLFMGVAMSITAMPVLAAIIRDRGLAGTDETGAMTPLFKSSVVRDVMRESSQVQVHALLGEDADLEDPLLPGGLISSADGMFWLQK